MTAAGSHVITSPSALTTNVSGLTSILGCQSLSRISAFLTLRHPLTTSTRFFNPHPNTLPPSLTPSAPTNAIPPPPPLIAPHISLPIRGSGVGMLAFASPTTPHATTPPLSTPSTRTPNPSPLHHTRSATLPTSIDPTRWPTPCVSAGLMVYLAM